MALLDQPFDATTVEPNTGYEILPAGDYKVQIVESEMRVTRNGQGRYLWLMMDVLSGPCKGRKLFDQLNLEHPNVQTVEIAQKSLSALCRAVNQMNVSDSEVLHFIPMDVTVAVKPGKNGYGDQNVIRYLDKDRANKDSKQTPPRAASSADSAQASMPASQAQPEASNDAMASAPWKRQN